jgi:hypothetical protein
MHYYLSSIFKYYREPKKFITALRNYLVSSKVDTFIVSWPKSGRTWLRFLIGKMLVDLYQLDPKNVFDLYQLSCKAGCDHLMMSHGGRFHFFDSGHYAGLKFNHQMFAHKKVIFLARDIRDILVSFYFQENRRTGIFRGSIQDFIRSDVFGAQKIVAFYNLWYTHRQELKNFQLVRYEDLHADTDTQFRKILSCINVEIASDEMVFKAIDFASFSNMKKMEKQRTFKDSLLRAENNYDAESAKVRKGKVGGYVEYLEDADCDYIDSIVRKIGIQECNWYYHNLP